MTEQEKREKVIRGLEMLRETRGCNDVYYTDCQNCAYNGEHRCVDSILKDALALLKRSFTPQEVYDTVIEHAQHDTRFKLGDRIDYSFIDVVDILNMELMCKAGDM